MRKPAIPTVKNAAWLRDGTDVFILAKLEAAGIVPNPDADRATPLRLSRVRGRTVPGGGFPSRTSTRPCCPAARRARNRSGLKDIVKNGYGFSLRSLR
ncbi:MAG: hypothetical protein WCK55_12465 [Verrucomicrobiota bacterium]